MTYIKVEKDSGGAVFPSNWNYCVGTGRLGLALQKEYLDALALVKKSIDFKYIRGHGLLCDDVGIYREDIVGDEVRLIPLKKLKEHRIWYIRRQILSPLC